MIICPLCKTGDLGFSTMPYSDNWNAKCNSCGVVFKLTRHSGTSIEYLEKKVAMLEAGVKRLIGDE